MRSFVAVAVEPEGSVASAPVHLTLRFLGDQTGETLAAAEQLLRPAVAPLSQFEIVVEGVGAFPSAERPRVVWRGVTTGEDALRRLASVARDAIRSAGIPDDPVPFTPHVTLFRVRSPRDSDRARALLDGRAPRPPATPVSVSEVLLLESRLTSGGAVHRIRARFPLTGAGP